jgi:hypothetical protein
LCIWHLLIITVIPHDGGFTYRVLHGSKRLRIHVQSSVELPTLLQQRLGMRKEEMTLFVSAEGRVWKGWRGDTTLPSGTLVDVRRNKNGGVEVGSPVAATASLRQGFALYKVPQHVWVGEGALKHWLGARLGGRPTWSPARIQPGRRRAPPRCVVPSTCCHCLPPNRQRHNTRLFLLCVLAR